MSLKPRKLDLHVHTQASHDFADTNSTLSDIVDRAVAVGLDGIAVTDHNSVDSIDEIKVFAQKKGLIIFPGFEISCGGAGEGPIHVVGIFDIDKTKSDLERILGKLEIKGKGENSLTNKSVSDVIDKIRENGGLPILAHANSSHGALSDIRGNPRLEVIKNINLLAVEATEGDFKKAVGKRLIDVLNGEDAQYKRKLPVYRASDNPAPGKTGHSVKTVGNEFTYFRMGEISVESLRQCLEDPDTRIVQADEKEKIEIRQPRIVGVTIEGGFLDMQKIPFHPGMNSIIGGTGTGKSLLIEFLRFLFNKPPHPDLLKEHKDKLEKQLRIGGEIKAKFIDSSGDEYDISRKYDSTRKPYESEVVCRNCTNNEDYMGDVNSIFPLLFYSQNEILEVTRDPSAQLNLLDNFRNFGKYRNLISGLSTNLKKLDHEVIESFSKANELPNLKKQESTIGEQIKKCEKKLKLNSPKEFGDFQDLEKQRNAATNKLIEFDTIIEQLDTLIEELPIKVIGPQPKNTKATPATQVSLNLNNATADILKILNESKKRLEAAKIKSQRAIQAWEKKNKFTTVKKKYEKAVGLKIRMVEIDTERVKLLEDKTIIENDIEVAKTASATFLNARNDRNDLLKQLATERKEYFKEREVQAKLITEKSEEKINIKILQEDDKTAYKENLLKLKVRSYAEEKEIDSIVKNINVIDFVELVLDHNFEKISQTADLTENKAENIVAELLKAENLAGLLSLQYASYPEDRIEILYQKQDKKYYPLAELSMGQKADALIMIALGDSQMPVIIDQPEDALDISSIWEDICGKLRKTKHERQFIFTTHNSSIAVSSDSDQYIVMEASAIKGWVSEIGSIDQQKIKEKVVGHLEGGYKSYNLKRKKYHL